MVLKPIRIAILEADTPLPNAKAKYGGYGGVFKALLTTAAAALGRPGSDGTLEIKSYHIVEDPENYPDLDNIDAVLITGSRHDAFSDTPWINNLVAYTIKVLSQSRVRLIGVCFGHQIIGRALGITVCRNTAWEAAVHSVNLSSKGQDLFGGRSTLNIHQMHRDIVTQLPENTQIEGLGTSPVCAVQGMYQDKRLFTIQGHPEFTAEIVREILQARLDSGVFEQEAFDEHIAKVDLPHDGLVVGKAFIKFMTD